LSEPARANPSGPDAADRRGVAARVSVLMPMRNPGVFLLPAVRSVLEQDYRELELIVIDDGSTDGSRECIAALDDARIVLVDGPRSGIPACLNAGLDRVSGRIVMRCDADDLYPAGRISAQVAWLDRHPEFIAVCGPFSMLDPGGAVVAAPFHGQTEVRLDGAERILDGRLRTHFCAFAFRHDVLNRAGRFRAFFETAEDIDFVLRLAEVGAIAYLPGDAYLYRLHGASITHTQASVRRRFFEGAAYEMSADRRTVGSDALMRGQPPAPPVHDAQRDRALSARLHMAQMLVGESWAAFGRGDRARARLQAWRAIAARPRHGPAWWALVLVSCKGLPGR
jgi:glycosyltransferase involved in cell wall biosynthesis